MILRLDNCLLPDHIRHPRSWVHRFNVSFYPGFELRLPWATIQNALRAFISIQRTIMQQRRALRPFSLSLSQISERLNGRRALQTLRETVIAINERLCVGLFR